MCVSSPVLSAKLLIFFLLLFCWLLCASVGNKYCNNVEWSRKEVGTDLEGLCQRVIRFSMPTFGWVDEKTSVEVTVTRQRIESVLKTVQICWRNRLVLMARVHKCGAPGRPDV